MEPGLTLWLQEIIDAIALVHGMDPDTATRTRTLNQNSKRQTQMTVGCSQRRFGSVPPR